MRMCPSPHLHPAPGERLPQHHQCAASPKHPPPNTFAPGHMVSPQKGKTSAHDSGAASHALRELALPGRSSEIRFRARRSVGFLRNNHSPYAPSAHSAVSIRWNCSQHMVSATRPSLAGASGERSPESSRLVLTGGGGRTPGCQNNAPGGGDGDRARIRGETLAARRSQPPPPPIFALQTGAIGALLNRVHQPLTLVVLGLNSSPGWALLREPTGIPPFSLYKTVD